uniref:WW domain-binding protein 11 n=1 Tax=Heterorhabditis bacteriophora TaxID=37862 RepID=A0A1I7XQH2_HETBA
MMHFVVQYLPEGLFVFEHDNFQILIRHSEMPSAAKTKSGRIFRAPTDQARKLERKRENKKNKRDRQQIRQTIAKCCDVDECTRKMLAIERQILGLDQPQFHPDVLKKKQKVYHVLLPQSDIYIYIFSIFQTIMDTLSKRRTVLQTMKDEAELKALNEKLQQYYSDTKKLQALAEQERMARTADINCIPLPEGDLAEGEMRTTQIMGPQPLKKKVEFKLPRAARGKLKPPGPPCGLPPDLSDSEGEGDIHDGYHLPIPADDDLAPVPIPDFDSRSGGSFSKYTPVMPLRKPPGPPPMPHPPMYNPMGLPMQSMSMSGNDGGAVISSAPVIRREIPKPSVPAPTVVSAAPQLRNLRKETVKLVPAVLKRRPQTNARPKVAVRRPPTEATQQAKTTDEAYNEFMKELGDLI